MACTYITITQYRGTIRARLELGTVDPGPRAGQINDVVNATAILNDSMLAGDDGVGDADDVLRAVSTNRGARCHQWLVREASIRVCERRELQHEIALAASVPAHASGLGGGLSIPG